jgi:DNA-binding MarR family transcriptional regulator
MIDSEPAKPSRDSIALLLGVLTAVEFNSNVTQRSMSSELGVALGLANAVLKRCVRKGLIKISTAPVNRYAYYLTPSGFSEKARLTAEYLRVSFDLFRASRAQYIEIFERFAVRGQTRIVLFGASELAESALLSSREVAVDIVGLVDPSRAGESYIGFPIYAALFDVPGGFDAVAFCEMRNPQSAYAFVREALARAGLGADRLLAPAVLRLNSAARATGGDA